MIQNELLKKLTRKMVAQPDDYMTSFRKNLMTYVDEKDISIQNIAEAANMSQETLKTLIYGKSADCKLSTAVSLAKALNISVDELVGCGTISPTMCESIQIIRNLPENFVYFVRWAIRYQERCLKEKKASKKAINVMYAECSRNGNLSMNNNYEVMDISNVEDFIRYKVFMGIRVPCEHYMPVLSEGDVLLLANDRNPLQNEMVTVVSKGYIRIVRRKEEKDEEGVKRAAYFSIRNGQFLAYEDDVEEVIGYVAKIVHPSNI